MLQYHQLPTLQSCSLLFCSKAHCYWSTDEVAFVPHFASYMSELWAPHCLTSSLQVCRTATKVSTVHELKDANKTEAFEVLVAWDRSQLGTGCLMIFCFFLIIVCIIICRFMIFMPSDDIGCHCWGPTPDARLWPARSLLWCVMLVKEIFKQFLVPVQWSMI